MNKLFSILLGASLFAGTATATLAATSGGDTYYWLHPKQGMVLVDRATNAIVVTSRSQGKVASQTAIDGQPAPEVATRETYKWLHPKLGFVTVDRATNAIVSSVDRTPAR